jgi:hypothetical protein
MDRWHWNNMRRQGIEKQPLFEPFQDEWLKNATAGGRAPRSRFCRDLP